jgi:DNA-binding PadR family transcriptional regulator
MEHGWNPPFELWMGRRQGWRGYARYGRHGRDFGIFASLFGEPGPRAERGGVKYLVLDAVADAPRHGYEIMQVIEERSRGAYRPSPGVVYPTLQLLDETGLLRGTEKDGRRVYELTEAGRRELEANRETVRDFYDQHEDDPWEVYADDLADFTRRLVGLVKTVRRAARHRRLDPKVIRRLRTVLDEAIARVEEILESDRS